MGIVVHMSDEIGAYDNIFDEPEKFGLMIVDRIYDGGYEWSAFVVWQRLDDGTMFWASDSGCSCYGPWDGVQDTDGLQELNSKTRSNFEAELAAFNDYETPQGELFTSKVRVLATVAGLIGG